MKFTRRDFVKSNAIAATAAAAGITLPGLQGAMAQGADTIRWDKAPCRFCGTGCSVLVGTKDGRVVATQGDPDAPVNRGLNCIKGYLLSKIMYGKDRLTTPLMRQKNGQYDKNGPPRGGRRWRRPERRQRVVHGQGARDHAGGRFRGHVEGLRRAARRVDHPYRPVRCP